MSVAVPFTFHVSGDARRDLAERLARTRWPSAGAAEWADGTDLVYLQELIKSWRHSYDWDAAEARIAALPNVRVRLGELEIHAVHLRGEGTRPLPLVMTHGWPGSFLEFLKIAPRLTHPSRYGGDPADAFDLVLPSLPGFGFSEWAPGLHPRAIAGLWLDLMTALGYERFGAQGGDWGSGVSTELAFAAPERVIGVHLNYVMRGYLPGVKSGLDFSPEELAYFDDSLDFQRREGAYVAVQSTKPQSLAYGLNDSPAGLAAWIVEKLHTWTDCHGDLESVLTRDEILTMLSLYWYTGTIAPSLRIYRERALQAPSPAPARPDVPFGVADFPKEISRPPRRLVERSFRVEHFTEMPAGGHFAALERPELLAPDVARFFRPYR